MKHLEKTFTDEEGNSFKVQEGDNAMEVEEGNHILGLFYKINYLRFQF